jgi:hypothetical protein
MNGCRVVRRPSKTIHQSTQKNSAICPQYCAQICRKPYLYTETESKLALAVLRGITGRQVADTLLPCLTWMRGYDLWRVLPCDMISGLSVGLMVVPQGLSYAGLVGVPTEYGLYAGMAKHCGRFSVCIGLD